MDNGRNMQGKTCVITGANSGIGKAAALALAKQGARVVMVCRDRARGETARAEIIQASDNDCVDLLIADLASQAAVRQLAAQLDTTYPKIDVLINNAGVYLGSRTLTVDGIETTFAINYLAPFLLTHLLLDKLKASAPSRILNLATWQQPPLDFDDLQRAKNYNQMDVYPQSKTALVMFSFALAKQLEGSRVTVNCASPGMIRTNFGRDVRGPFRLFLTLVKPFMTSAAKGAAPLVYLASSPEVAGANGKFFEGTTDKEMPAALHDPGTWARLEKISGELVQLPQGV